ncbi:MAG TPA: sigma-70 family RNA polymerase sigma factor [Gemmataceae bacterium]
MASGQLRTLLQHLQRLAAPGPRDLTDAQLLESFVADRDDASFEVLVWRHGPLVYHVCRRVLRDADDVEDAFQATFLILARKAAAVRKRATIGAWLHQVAHRVALRARAARRPVQSLLDADLAAPDTEDALLWCDLRPVLDEEVQRLPAKYRDAIVLFYLAGHTTEEAARQLGCPRGTVLSRLAWARERLRKRLTQRGVAFSAGALAASLMHEGSSASAPAALLDSTVRAATALASGKAAASAHAALLMEGVLRSMFLTKLKTTAALGALTILIGLSIGLWGGRRATADAPDPAREATSNTRIALLNLTYVMKNCDEFKELQEVVKKRVAFYEERAKISRTKIDRLRQELATPDLALGKRDTLEMDIRAEQRTMEDEQTEAKRKLAEITDEQTVALFKKVRDAATRYANAHNFDVVLHYSDAADEKEMFSPSNVSRKFQAGACMPLYWKADMDISKAVVAAMNAAHHATMPGGAPVPRGQPGEVRY